MILLTIAAGWSAIPAAAEAGRDGKSLGKYEFTEIHMGVDFKLVFYADDADAANRAAAAAFGRIKALNGILSDYLAESELSRLSNTAPQPQPVGVSGDLWTVLRHAQALAERTHGAFDVTVGPYTSLWRRARRRKEMPAADRLAAARAAVGFQFLRLDEKARTAQLLQPGMRLDLGGIAKGYAADEALRVLCQHGIRRGLVDGSGDIAIGDPPPGEAGWRIGIAPLEPGAAPSRYLLLARQAIATSGDAWQHVEIDGVRYSHIIDPKTGLGLTQRSSVSVVARNCITADSLASAVSVLGPVDGLKLIDKSCGCAAMIVLATGRDAAVETFFSNRFKKLPTSE
jgi:thiamine biosynthesis lipoprotein